MELSDEEYEGIMRQWDSWREYIADGGGGSWPRDAFEAVIGSLLEGETTGYILSNTIRVCKKNKRF